MYTANEIIKSALRKLSAYSSTDTLEADVANDALAVLQDLLDGWYGSGIMDYTTITTDITLSAGTLSYPLTAKSFDVLGMLVQDASGQDYSLRQIDEVSYNRISDKATQDRPYRYLLKQTADSSISIILYPVPNDAETLKVTHKSRPVSFDTLFTVSTMPTEYNTALIWSLAAELWVEYPNPDVQAIVFGKAEKTLNALIDARGSKDITTLSTDIMGTGGFYNIDCDCYV